MAKLAASNAGGQAVVANGDLLVDEAISKGIGTLCHGTNEDANTLLGGERVDVVPDVYQRGLETERHLAAVGRKVIGDGILDYTKQLLLRVG